MASETPVPDDIPDEGAVLTHERTFTAAEVIKFGELTGDQQPIHSVPDDEGRLMVQGLLSGSLMTEIGSDLGYIARTIEYEFLEPVYTGDTIAVECTITSKTEQADRTLLEIDVTFSNDRGAVVIEASTTGLVWTGDRP